jgi:hypothetical protein
VAASPKIFVVVPGVEDLNGIASLLALAGARITDRRREFVIDGPLSPERAAAVWALMQFEDSNSDGNQLDIRAEPDGDVAAALRAMCPQRPDPTLLDVDREDGIRWWAEQQRIQRDMLAAKAATSARGGQPATAPAPADSNQAACCGGHDYSPAAGEPLVLGCAMCPRSPTYWRLPENRADGREYAPLPPIGDPDSPIKV